MKKAIFDKEKIAVLAAEIREKVDLNVKKARNWASKHTDTKKAAERIKANVEIKGANAVVLACSILIASIGLNVNSTAVIIGAMLISPLMGPIIGAGLAIGTNDWTLFWKAMKNLGIMVGISLGVSTVFFFLSPLRLVNPTELVARTSPSFYDVLIAFVGGLAGIFESLRKDNEKGTVIVGVAIATALMPPLCTVGYGLAHLNPRFIFGAAGLFAINCFFIAVATYLMVLVLFPVNKEKAGTDRMATRAMGIIGACLIISGGFSMIRMSKDSKLERNVDQFVTANKIIGKSYIHDYKMHSGKNRYADIFFAGEGLTNEELQRLYASAEQYHIAYDQLNIVEHSFGNDDDALIQDVFDRTEAEMGLLENRIKELEMQLDSVMHRVFPDSTLTTIETVSE
ncbi:MAG: DUF389 domain-containing protein [Bacteroidales bacterium]|nr:DUF389 domain-containing protein [Bacteroidales bacterium]